MRPFSTASAIIPALTALLLVPAAGHAQNACGKAPSTLTAPVAFLTAGNTCLDLTSFIVPVAGALGRYQIVAPSAFTIGGNSVLFTPGANQFKVDPYINFGFTSTNATGSPVTYTVSFFTPITPGLYGSALASGGVSVTDVSGGTSSVAMDGAPAYIQAFGSNGPTLTNLGVNVTGTPCATTTTTTTQTCGYGTRTSTFAPAFYNNLEAVLTYTQTGVGAASWSGGVSITASTVPEPSTWALFGTGLLAVGGMASRRRRRSGGIA